MTLEDETDIANIIVWPKAFEKNRRVVMTARFLAVRGRLQRAGLVDPCGRGKVSSIFPPNSQNCATVHSAKAAICFRRNCPAGSIRWICSFCSKAAIFIKLRVPGAVQHEVVRCRTETVRNSEFTTIPDEVHRHVASKTLVNALWRCTASGKRF